MLTNFKLLDTFLDIHQNRRSGVLRFEKGPEKKQLVLDQGLLVFAESNLPEEHLVRILVKLDLLPRTEVNGISSLMKTGKTSEEAILELSGSGTQDLERGRREQAIIILASLWAWDTCKMRFYPGEKLIRCHVNLRLPLPEALVLSSRHAVSGHMIQVPRDFIQGTFRITKDCAAKAMGLPLDNSESYVYSLLQDPVHASDVLALLPATEAKPEEILLRLCLLGMVAIEHVDVRSGGSGAEVEPSSVILQLDDLLSKFETASLYGILSVPPEASQLEIQAAYHQMAKQFHPDRFQSREFSAETHSKAEQAFTCINKAYVTLKDPVSRTDYDEKRLVSESKVEAELKARSSKQSEDAKTADALYRDGRALLVQGDFEKAVERLKGCIWLDPEKAAYHHYLGVAESEMPKLRKSAEQHFLKAIELNKTAAASRLELAKLYIKVELRRKAEQQLQELMRWNPGNHEVQRLLTELNIR
jgi:curved DNA-binding protein CbpA